ncbi:hypothetical protein FH972_021539 [Carpinus fangiana]|uniref:Uncharacterized protein n=1 Tax=Carpinus fangiana TaxID=176857 RepID=A0A5N6KRS5_9ROSI|nr:hypothetical protein FH972_021539 [Carpinus fangiana]
MWQKLDHLLSLVLHAVARPKRPRPSYRPSAHCLVPSSHARLVRVHLINRLAAGCPSVVWGHSCPNIASSKARHVVEFLSHTTQTPHSALRPSPDASVPCGPPPRIPAHTQKRRWKRRNRQFLPVVWPPPVVALEASIALHTANASCSWSGEACQAESSEDADCVSCSRVRRLKVQSYDFVAMP